MYNSKFQSKLFLKRTLEQLDTQRMYLEKKSNNLSELTIQVEGSVNRPGRNRRNILKLLANWRIILLIILSVASIVAFSVVTFLKGPELIKLLNYARDEILKQPHWGVLSIVTFCFLSCFPPFTGHGFCAMFTGYIFGVGWGFLIIYPTTVLGIIGCYWFGRLLFYSQVQNLLDKFPTIKKLDRRIEKDGIKLVILLRLGPYPFSWLNLMFSSISVPFWKYFWVVVVVNIRVLLTIYIGTTLDTLLDMFHSGLNGNKPQLIGFCVSMSFLVISSVYTIYYFRRSLKETDNEDVENPANNV